MLESLSGQGYCLPFQVALDCALHSGLRQDCKLQQRAVQKRNVTAKEEAACEDEISKPSCENSGGERSCLLDIALSEIKC